MRYGKQELLPVFGPRGQERLSEASVVIIGCGGLGCSSAALLARAGVGELVIVDRDVVEMDNLHRQILFTEAHAREGRPKAEAAVESLSPANTEIKIRAGVADVTSRNAQTLLADADLVVDGTDNAETRYLLNEVCVQADLPWIYGGSLRTEAVAMAIRPGCGPCFRCAFPDPPEPGVLPTCETEGVLNAAVTAAASFQAAQGIRFLATGQADWGRLVHLDLWTGAATAVEVSRQEDCPVCGLRRFDLLEAAEAAGAVKLCGREAVQITPPRPLSVPLTEMAQRLSAVAGGELSFKGHILRFAHDGLILLLFPDGRAIIKGTSEPARARQAYAKFVGV